MPAEYVTDVNEIIGKVASRAINPNEVIHENSVAKAPVIKTGDRILIVYESPNLKLTASGISLQEGVRGDRIKVSEASIEKLKPRIREITGCIRGTKI